MEKPSGNAKKRNLEASFKKIRKKCEKMRSWSQLGINLAPQRKKKNFYPTGLDGIRGALSEELRSTTKAWDALIANNLTRWRVYETPAHGDAPRSVAR